MASKKTDLPEKFSAITISDGDGGEYTLRYPRRLVRAMDKKGVNAQTAAEKLGEGTLSAAEEFVETFVAPAFKADQPDMTLDEVTEVWESIPDKTEFIKALSELFSQPLLALIADPTETRMKWSRV